MLRKFIWGMLALTSVALALVMYFYLTAKHQALDEAQAGAQRINTPLGIIEYRITGDTGPYILYVSAAGYDAPPLVQGQYRNVIVSRPGYLGTPLTAGASAEAQAHLYAALLDALHIDSVVVVTMSAGGPSALSFAALYPERTRGLIAVAPASQAFQARKIPGFLQADFRYWAVMNFVESLGDATLVNALLPNQHDVALITANPQAMATVRSLAWALWPISVHLDGLNNDVEQFLHMTLPTKLISAPVLIIHGTKDQTVDFTDSQTLVASIAGARLQHVEGGGHMLNVNHAQEIESAIRKFLLELSED